MNRQVKFKAWNITESRMFEVYGFNKDFVFEKTLDSPDLNKNIIDIEKCKLMQYTGFNDIDGNEIYEGDILEYVNVRDCTQKKTTQVYFDIQMGSWCTKSNFKELWLLIFEQHNDEWKVSQNWNINKNQYVRLIGNIYENPELLKKNK